MTEEPDLAIDLGIRSVPTVFLFKGDRLLEKIIGLKPKKLYYEMNRISSHQRLLIMKRLILLSRFIA